MSWHRSERAVLADALAAAGPGTPTLCEGWRAEHLAAHVVLRERSPLAAAGIALPPLTARTSRLTLKTGDAATDPAGFAALVTQVRQGPPAWSPLRWAGDLVQHVELFVHAEDVRRGAGPVPARTLPAAQEDALWRALTRSARLLYRDWLRTHGLVLAAPGRTARVGRRPVDPDADLVLRGSVGELVLHAYGRTSAADVTLEGAPPAVAQMQADVRRV
ncbi:TIGR03085 family metal-binding protein [Isoptericola sp. b441]|uniref:TIGR03085 family metal-binding protein n=1 Tax=Actinotalea lenta TaxID=3064654 RepID=A0ABT9D9K6_9CELL|nr:TIGR03085 family metal-binding protein [Isoptericola sp. b441]MDO8107566.1 TIGR03085 family metal-binding protein [Isoptericola sp. b441]